jgi:hypothetical protein
MFRLQNYRKFCPRSTDTAKLNPRMRRTAPALLLPFHENEVAEAIFAALEDHILQAEADRQHEPEALVIKSLSYFCHEEKSAAVLVGQLAGHVNESLKKSGEEGNLKPRAVGAILKSLGLRTEKVSSVGRGIRLSHPVEQRIHRLMQSYNFTCSRSNTDYCGICEEMSL